MRKPFAAGVAVFTLAVEVSGAFVGEGERSYFHTALGCGLAGLVLILAVWCLLDKNSGVRALAVVAVLAAGFEAVPGAALLHACMAPVLFTAVVLIAAFPFGRPEAVKPGLQFAVTAMPPLVLLQIVLGAAYRHKLASVMLHMGGALLVAGWLLAVSVILLQRYPENGYLRRAAHGVLGMALVQVSLGITVFLLRLLDLDTVLAFKILAAAHICGGALTLAAGSVLAVRYRLSTATVWAG